MRNEINKLFNARKNRPLKYSAWAVIGIAIAAMIAMIIWFDDIPPRIMLFIRGCVGVCAVIFVILVAILTYRVYSEYYRNKH